MSPEILSTENGTPAVAGPRAPTRVVVVAWLLAVVALVPPGTVLGQGFQILRGSLDRQYFGSFSAEDQSLEAAIVPQDITFWDRWGVLFSAVPHEPALLTSTGVTALLAGLHVAGGWAWPLGRAFRGVAAGVAWLTSAIAAAILVLTLVSAGRPASDRVYSSFYYPSDLFAVLVPVAAMLVVLGFTLVSGILLVGPAVPAPPREDPEDPEDLDELEEGPRPSATSAEPGGQPSGPPTTAQLRPEREAAPVAFPRPTAEEYAAYRRPAS